MGAESFAQDRSYAEQYPRRSDALGNVCRLDRLPAFRNKVAESELPLSPELI